MQTAEKVVLKLQLEYRGVLSRFEAASVAGRLRLYREQRNQAWNITVKWIVQDDSNIVTVRFELSIVAVVNSQVYLSALPTKFQISTVHLCDELFSKIYIVSSTLQVLSPTILYVDCSVGKASFKYDMRRLSEILAFPRAWYRRSIARRLFLGDTAEEK